MYEISQRLEEVSVAIRSQWFINVLQVTVYVHGAGVICLCASYESTQSVAIWLKNKLQERAQAGTLSE